MALLATRPVLTLSLIRLQTRVREQLQRQRSSTCHRLIGGGAIRWVASILRSLLPHETLQQRHKRQRLKPPLIVDVVVGVAQHNDYAYISACYEMNDKLTKLTTMYSLSGTNQSTDKAQDGTLVSRNQFIRLVAPTARHSPHRMLPLGEHCG